MNTIKKVSVINAVIDEIKKKIASMSIGDKLPPEQTMCEELGVGRSTVREALRVLQAMGFLEIKLGRGAFIASKSENTENNAVDWFMDHHTVIRDYMQVRMAIEPLAVKLAIENATPEEVAELESILNAYSAAVEKLDPLKLSLCDQAFHNQIIKATHNLLMVSINHTISKAFLEYRNKALAIKENAKNALQPHIDILMAIKDRDVEAGQKAMIEHLNHSLEDINRVVS